MDRIFDGSHWLASWEQEEVIAALATSPAELLKWDNSRMLPLKSGGTTDIYINLRNARNDPNAVALISRVFANPLRRLGVHQFGEVPDAVSCFAGPLSISTALPFVTLREHVKVGRATNATVIGNLRRGEKIAIIDDVITDGASKVAPVRTCLSAGVDLAPLVVLVDRQQGWRRTFANEGLNELQVWSGMSLHRVRRYLIEHGLMERCKPEVENKNPIIVALDGKSWDEVLPIVERLRTTGCIFKVNDLLFWEGYASLVRELGVYGRIMVDLKGHDIPNTLDNIAKRFAKNPPWAVTVHASGGVEMIKKVVEAFKGTPTKVLAVTVLTSMDETTCVEIFSRQPLEQVRQLALIAVRAGAHGLVCSSDEVYHLKDLHPTMQFVTPGIRSPGVDSGDQKRIGTPAGAIQVGASYIVMGRQILEAADPVAEVSRVLKDELKID